MPETETRLRDYVVQLDVEAIAVVSVRAESAEAACAIAEVELRPVDVTAVRSAEAAIVSGPHPVIFRGARGIVSRGRQAAQEAAAHGGQA